MKTLTISKQVIEQLTIAAEISSKAYYNQFLQSPTWPTGSSGVTVGIGYDLGYNSASQIKKDWQGLVDGSVLSFMISCSGLTGLNAKKKITAAVRGFKISYDVACKVFFEKTLPRFVKDATAAFAGLEKLNPAAQAVIVDLVFNRGTSMGVQGKDSWNTRKEMRELVPLIAKADYKAIAAKLLEMKRLWDGLDDVSFKQIESEQRIAGLLSRCNNRADIVIRSTTQTNFGPLHTFI